MYIFYNYHIIIKFTTKYMIRLYNIYICIVVLAALLYVVVIVAIAITVVVVVVTGLQIWSVVSLLDFRGPWLHRPPNSACLAASKIMWKCCSSPEAGKMITHDRTVYILNKLDKTRSSTVMLPLFLWGGDDIDGRISEKKLFKKNIIH